MNLSAPLKTKLETIVGVGVLTFVGAFVGFLSMHDIPTTLDGWKPILASALATAIAGELVYMRTTIAGLLAGNVLTSLEPTITKDVTADVGKVVPKIPPVVGLMLCLALAAFLPGCAGLSAAMVDQLKADAAKDATATAACVLGQVVSGNEDALSIGITCGTSEAALIAQQLATVLEKPASDAGVGAAPATDRLTLAARLRAVR